VRLALQTSSHEAAVSAAVHGGGLACLARFRADREDWLIRLAVPSFLRSREADHRSDRISFMSSAFNYEAGDRTLPNQTVPVHAEEISVAAVQLKNKMVKVSSISG
jgi:hypothetical protein